MAMRHVFHIRMTCTCCRIYLVKKTTKFDPFLDTQVSLASTFVSPSSVRLLKFHSVSVPEISQSVKTTWWWPTWWCTWRLTFRWTRWPTRWPTWRSTKNIEGSQFGKMKKGAQFGKKEKGTQFSKKKKKGYPIWWGSWSRGLVNLAQNFSTQS